MAARKRDKKKFGARNSRRVSSKQSVKAKQRNRPDCATINPKPIS